MAWRAHPHWHLILLGNRDEFHARPAAPLARWREAPSLIGGRDLQSGGTWLGLSNNGRIVIVTNRRGFGPADPSKASRGILVRDLLTRAGAYADPSTTELDDFNPFNLIFIDAGDDGGTAHFLTNRPRATSMTLAPGLYGLSNGGLDEPWPKTRQLKDALKHWMTVEADGQAHNEMLFGALRNEHLPDVGMMLASTPDMHDEAANSPVFICDPIYGTRCSTIVAIDVQGHGIVTERRFDAKGARAGDTRMEFRWRL